MIVIPDEKVTRALEILDSNRAAYARAAMESSERSLKVLIARLKLQSNAKTGAEREDFALASDQYEHARKQHDLVAEAYYEAQDQRKAAEALLDAWRTLSATNRSLGRAAA
jgi:3-hydroxyacyl-CoA dehydrogenase